MLREMRSDLRIERLGETSETAFLALHDDRHGAGWCRCVAWYVPTWDGWMERTVAENLALRCALHAEGRHDGLLAFVDETPVGWAQLGPRDRLPKLVAQLALDADPGVWAVTCLLVAPAHRRSGVAAALLGAAKAHAREAGATRLEGYPRTTPIDEDGDAWTGTPALFAAAGFSVVRDGAPRAVVAIDL
jgi:GNAT superfamily N-acetyltransferase